jgi:hypothetical protein
VNIFMEKTANRQKENDLLTLWLVSDATAHEGFWTPLLSYTVQSVAQREKRW